jgi:hypothetical protein
VSRSELGRSRLVHFIGRCSVLRSTGSRATVIPARGTAIVTVNGKSHTASFAVAANGSGRAVLSGDWSQDNITSISLLSGRLYIYSIAYSWPTFPTWTVPAWLLVSGVAFTLTLTALTCVLIRRWLTGTE